MKNKKLKFCIELDEQGLCQVEIIGNIMDIGRGLFYPFFVQKGMSGKAVAFTIHSAMKLAYPDIFK